MAKKTFLSLAVLAAVAAACSSSGAMSSPAPMASASAAGSDVVALYTADQARSGEAAYDRTCLECHTKVEFKERPFLFAWEGSSVAQIYTYIAENMPDDGPASLDESEYLEIMAYILEMNGYPAGSDELTADVERMQDVPFEAQGSRD